MLCKTTISHGHFIAVTFARSLGRYLNTLPSSLVFAQLPRTLQMLMHEKPWVIPILMCLKNLMFGFVSPDQKVHGVASDLDLRSVT